MEIILENRIRINKAPDILLQLLMSRLRIINPKYLEAQAAGRSLYGLDKYIINFIMLPNGSILVPRGIRHWLIKKCDEFQLDYNIVDKRAIFDHIDIDSSQIIYRPYQSKAVVSMISTAPEGILMAPAGSGKTIMGLSLIPLLGQPTLWLTHTGPLARQAKERAEKFLPDLGNIGLIGNSKWEVGDVLTIGMIQTLVRNPDKLVKTSRYVWPNKNY